ncbi:hypothetical protein L6466_13115 [Prevotella communis]|uniref:hypothetical protein n=1 Tax=Prevotella communis TaxID=2913614 RepID=UPI001EDC34DE|nr:hypothetical protein [Prevotella communis]UKK67618.1 hypothetical protein L6464_13550 [Prevotella communis]UKK70235.1 hypothetical protein L6466_13115 [Prevotella communis]
MKFREVDMSNDFDFSVYPNCEIHCVVIEINGERDLSDAVSEISQKIADTSWISKLPTFFRDAFLANAPKTIDKIVNEILNKVASGLNEKIGEYLVSFSAQQALETLFHHYRLPLAEILKEQLSNNPGFDFHTISHKDNLIHGEAKYGGKDTRWADATDQISDFIDENKHQGEQGWLYPFLSAPVIANVNEGKRGFTAAFSMHAQKEKLIFRHAMESDASKKIAQYEEYYLIAVVIC